MAASLFFFRVLWLMFVVKSSSQNHKVLLMSQHSTTVTQCFYSSLPIWNTLYFILLYFKLNVCFNFYYVYLSLFHALMHYRCFFKSSEPLLWLVQSSLGSWFLCCPYWYSSCFYAATSCGHLETSSALNPLVSVFKCLLSNLRIISSSVMFLQSIFVCVSCTFSRSDVDDRVYLCSYSSKSCVLPSVFLTARPLDHSCL